MSETNGIERDESPTLGKLAAALAKAQGAMHHAEKDATNSGYGRKYATLASTWDACRGALAENGLAVVQRVGGDVDRVIITTDLLHAESGEFMRSRVALPAEVDGRRNGAQAMGTAISYMRRYALAALVGVAQEDDDAETAGGPAHPHPPPRQAPRPQPARPKAPEAAPPAPAPAGSLPTTFPGFGSQKGKPLAGAKTGDLAWYARVLRENVADPKKARFKAENSDFLEAIERALGGQRERAANDGPPDDYDGPPPPGDEDAPF